MFITLRYVTLREFLEYYSKLENIEYTGDYKMLLEADPADVQFVVQNCINSDALSDIVVQMCNETEIYNGNIDVICKKFIKNAIWNNINGFNCHIFDVFKATQFETIAWMITFLMYSGNQKILNRFYTICKDKHPIFGLLVEYINLDKISSLYSSTQKLVIRNAYETYITTGLDSMTILNILNTIIE